MHPLAYDPIGAAALWLGSLAAPKSSLAGFVSAATPPANTAIPKPAARIRALILFVLRMPAVVPANQVDRFYRETGFW
jgi:hypothetical protein